jgi:CPA2 family monovalent cation:H+ antiporter-2
MRWLHLPPIPGCLLIGIVAGHHTLGWVADSDSVHLLGEIGVAFLLVVNGLEISLRQFMAMRGAVVGARPAASSALRR